MPLREAILSAQYFLDEQIFERGIVSTERLPPQGSKFGTYISSVFDGVTLTILVNINYANNSSKLSFMNAGIIQPCTRYCTFLSKPKYLSVTADNMNAV